MIVEITSQHPTPPCSLPLTTAYKQDPADDRRLAETVPNGGGYEQREALCAAIRLRERAILARCEFASLQRAKALRKR